MTRNEWIAETARHMAATSHSEYAHSGVQDAMLIWAEIAWTDATTLANAAERRDQAPWQADALSAAVATSERKAAAQALREAAQLIQFEAGVAWDVAIASSAKWNDKLHYHAQVARKQGMYDAASALSARADQVEKGEA